MAEIHLCELCGDSFSILNRQRLCQQCNRWCCAKCIDTNYVSPRVGNSDTNGSEPADTCTDCIWAEATSHSISVQEELNVTEEINRGLKNELKQRIIAMEKFRTFMVEFCETFVAKSTLFQDHENNDMDTEDNIDGTMPIVTLVDHCQERLHNIRTKVKMMRLERDNAINKEASQRRNMRDIQIKLDEVTRERDELQENIRKMNQTILEMEAELQQLADIKRECDNLKERCTKMEAQTEYASGRFSTTSIWGQRNQTQQESRWSYLASLVCPRIGI